MHFPNTRTQQSTDYRNKLATIYMSYQIHIYIYIFIHIYMHIFVYMHILFQGINMVNNSQDCIVSMNGVLLLTRLVYIYLMLLVLDGLEVLGDDGDCLVAVALLSAVGTVSDDNGRVGRLQSDGPFVLFLCVHQSFILSQKLVLDPFKTHSTGHEHAKITGLEAASDSSRFTSAWLEIAYIAKILME